MARKRHYTSMISEERSAPCNLPRNVIEKEWDKRVYTNMDYIDSAYSGVQDYLEEDARQYDKAMKK